MSKKTVYLAGPIGGYSYEACTGWREEAAGYLCEYGIEALSPMRGKHYLAETKCMDSAAPSGDQVLSHPDAVLFRDRWDCQRASLVLVNLLGASKVSIGTVLEIAWADSVRTPIVLVMEDEGNIHEHFLIREMCAFKVDTLEKALELITVIL